MNHFRPGDGLASSADLAASAPSPRICALVVTFNRKALVLECLSALRRQTYPLTAICLVNNASSDGTADALYEAGYLSAPTSEASLGGAFSDFNVVPAAGGGTIAVHYLQTSTNCGGAGGFSEAMRMARRFGYDGYWLMDDDAVAAPDALAALMQCWEEPQTAAVACAVVSHAQLALMHRGFFDFRFNNVFPMAHRVVPAAGYREGPLDIDMASFVGLLVKAGAARAAGLPCRRFFIQHDDTEYCIRLREQGRIVLVPAAVIDHREADHRPPSQRRVLFLSSSRPPLAGLTSLYFSLRNLTWIGRRYHRNHVAFAAALLMSWGRAVGSILLFDHDYKLRRLRLITAAYLDGLRGSFDNDKPRRLTSCSASGAAQGDASLGTCSEINGHERGSEEPRRCARPSERRR
jgi:GT2 family glycosyltransferase